MNHFQANLCLLCVTFCWSTEVIIFACIPDGVSPFATTCITSLVGGALLLLAFFRRIRAALARDRRTQLLRCLFLSVLNCAYNLLYQFGLKDFDVSTGAFTLCLTVTILPLVMFFQRTRVERKTWISSGLVLAGILCAILGVVTREQLPGFLIITLGCVIRAVYILKLNQYARAHDPVVLSAGISVIVGGMSFALWCGDQPGTFAAIPWSPAVVASLAIYAYFIVAFAQTLNVFAQRRATPSGATIIYAMEIVFSVLWGAFLPASLIAPVAVTPQLLVGLVFVVVGNLVELAEPGILRRRSGPPAGEGAP